VKLFYSPTSPYVRKVMACAVTRGLDGQIERLTTNPHVSPPELVAQNPLSKVPCLVTEDGLALFDSPVICEFLDTLGEAPPLFPPHGAARWRALKFQALGDGILDSAVGTRGELGRPREAARDEWIARQKGIVARALDQLQADPPHKALDIGSITIACALGYLDLRFADDAWRNGRPRLAAWYEAFETNPGIAQTRPA
jgi:glutathione S-transferase